MSQTCETVKVCADNDDGFIVINKSDLTKEHEVFGEKKAPKKKVKKND